MAFIKYCVILKRAAQENSFERVKKIQFPLSMLLL